MEYRRQWRSTTTSATGEPLRRDGEAIVRLRLGKIVSMPSTSVSGGCLPRHVADRGVEVRSG